MHPPERTSGHQSLNYCWCLLERDSVLQLYILRDKFTVIQHNIELRFLQTVMPSKKSYPDKKLHTSIQNWPEQNCNQNSPTQLYSKVLANGNPYFIIINIFSLYIHNDIHCITYVACVVSLSASLFNGSNSLMIKFVSVLFQWILRLLFFVHEQRPTF